MRPTRPLLLAGTAYAFVGVLASPIDGVDSVVGCAHETVDKGKSLHESRAQCVQVAEKPVPWEEELAIGGACAVKLVGAKGLIIDRDSGDIDSANNKLTRYLNIVGRNLAAQSARPNGKWMFGILDDPKDNPQVNAFSTPGGYVFVSKTLLKRVDNEAQLAAVLAHEIAHVTQQHGIHQYQEAKKSVCNWAVATAIGGAVAATGFERLLDSAGAGGVLDLNDSANDKLTQKLAEDLSGRLTSARAPELEFEADRVAVELLVSAGYRPDDMLQFIHRMPEGGPLFRSHPKPAEREAALRKWREDYCHPPNGGAATLLAADCPFDAYPSVPLPAEMKAAIAAL